MALSSKAEKALRDLEQFSDEELATICRMALTGKEEAIREIVDWAVPDIIFGPAKAITEGRQTGVIKSYNDAKGFGFITSPEIIETFGKDIFVSSHQMLHFPVGAEVTFAVLLNKGKHQAFDLAFLHEKRGSAARKGVQDSRTERADEIGKGKAAGRGRIEEESFMMQGCPDGKGWGPWGMGMWDGGYHVPVWPGYPGKGWYDCKGGFPSDTFDGKGSCMGKQTMGKGRPSPKPRDASVGHHVSGLSDQRFHGRIKSYGKKYGYGFIVSDELKDRFDKDIFAHAHELERLTKDLESTVGANVIFSVAVTDEDKPIAIDIEYDDGPPKKRSRVER